MWTIAKKEIVSNLVSYKFFIVILLTVILIFTSFFIMHRDFKERVSDYNIIRPEPHEPIAVIPPNPLSIFVKGLDEAMARFTGVSDEDLFTQIIDYGNDYPKGEASSLGKVSYGELKSGTIRFDGQDVPTVPVSSYVRALEIARILKSWIEKGEFYLTDPQVTLPGVDNPGPGIA